MKMRYLCALAVAVPFAPGLPFVLFAPQKALILFSHGNPCKSTCAAVSFQDELAVGALPWLCYLISLLKSPSCGIAGVRTQSWPFFFFFLILQSFHGTPRLLKNVYLDVEALAGSFDLEVRPW